MSKSKELAKNTLIISIGKVSTQVISFFLLPLYTSKISTDAYGDYDYVITVAAFLVPILTMLMEESMFRFMIDVKTYEEKKRIITQTFIYSIFSAMFFSVLFWGVIKCIICYDRGFEIWIYSIASLMLALSNSVSRGEGNIFLYSVSNFMVSVFTILGNLVLILVFHWQFNALFMSSVIAYTIASLCVFINLRVWKYISVSEINAKLMLSMLKYSLPLIPNTISWSVINVSDRIVIMNFIGPSANGLYSVSNKFPGVINSFYGFFNIAWRESSAKMAKEKNFEEIKKIYRMSTSLIFGVTIIMITGIRIFYPVFVSEQYQKGILYIPFLAMSVFYLSLAGFFGGIFTAYKDTKILGTTSFIAAALNLVIDLLLVKHIGLYAAAISTFFSSFFLYIYRKIKVKKYVVFDSLMNRFFLLSLTLASIIFYMDNSFITWCSFLTAIVVFIFLNKKLLLQIYSNIVERIEKFFNFR